MGRNTSISLGEHHEDFIQEQLKLGAYKNASEVVRAGLRLLQEREQKIVMLKQALDAGIQSGITTVELVAATPVFIGTRPSSQFRQLDQSPFMAARVQKDTNDSEAYEAVEIVAGAS